MQRLLGKALVRATKWTIDGGVPSAQKLVLIAAPHTSNWDFLHAMSTLYALGLPVRWMGKNSLFRGPMGPVLRALGGIAVERSHHGNMVQTMIDEFAKRPALVLLVPAEGTRSAGKRWRSGFYHIARGAGVPIGLGYLDYPTKRAGIGPLLWPTGNIKDDMAHIRDFYADKVGKYPEQFTPPRLREEEEPVSPRPLRIV